MDLGIGIVKALETPPLGFGKVIVLNFRSTHSSGIEHSWSLAPVASPISKATDIQVSDLGSTSRIFSIISSVSAGFNFFGDNRIT